MSVALVIGLTLAAVAAFVGLLTLPRWFARRLGQDRIWRLRDEFVHEILIDETLPKGHPAVKQLVRKMDWALRDGKHFTLLHVYLADRSVRQLDRARLNKLKATWAWGCLDGLEPDQRDLLILYRKTFEMRLVGALLLGSWFGLAQVARRLPTAISHQLAARRTEPDPQVSVRRVEISFRRIELEVRESAQRAADQVVADTPFGMRLSERLRDIMVSSVAATRDYEPQSGTVRAPIRAA